MFLLLRLGLAIAVIFYCSPVRRQSAEHDHIGSIGSRSAPRPVGPAPASERRASPPGRGAAPAAEESARSLLPEAERLWSTLPPDAQRAVLDRLRDEVGAVLAGGPETRGDTRPAAGAVRAGDRQPDRRPEELPRRP